MNEYGQCNHTKYEGCPPCIHDAYAQGYLDGYTDAENHYTNICILCGTGGTVSPPLCIPCKDVNKLLTQTTVSCKYPVEWKWG